MTSTNDREAGCSVRALTVQQIQSAAIITLLLDPRRRSCLWQNATYEFLRLEQDSFTLPNDYGTVRGV